MSNYLSITEESLKELNQYPDGVPLRMLNLLKFTKKTEEGVSGRQKYREYMNATVPFFKKAQGKVILLEEVQMNLIGPHDSEQWDEVLIAEYPSKSAFLEMIMDKDYPADLRSQALEDSRLILCGSLKGIKSK